MLIDITDATNTIFITDSNICRPKCRQSAHPENHIEQLPITYFCNLQTLDPPSHNPLAPPHVFHSLRARHQSAKCHKNANGNFTDKIRPQLFLYSRSITLSSRLFGSCQLFLYNRPNHSLVSSLRTFPTFPFRASVQQNLSPFRNPHCDFLHPLPPAILLTAPNRLQPFTIQFLYQSLFEGSPLNFGAISST